MSRNTRSAQPRTMTGGPNQEIRSALDSLIQETRDLNTRTDASVKDFGSTVTNLAKKVDEIDGRTSKALEDAGKALTEAQGAQVGVKFDELQATMRSAVERLDKIEAQGQRPKTRAAGGPQSMDAAFAEHTDELERFMRASTRGDRVRIGVPRLDDCAPHMRAATWPVLGDTEFGSFVQDVYRPGAVSFGYDPIGLWDLVPKMPAFTGDTVKAPRWTSKSDHGFVKTLVNGAITGASTAVAAVTLDSTAGMHAGAWVRFYTAGSGTLLGRRKIVTITSTTVLTFATDDIDFNIADNDECLCESIATTAEGVAKPAGYFGSELLSASAQVIAAYTKIAKQSMATVPGLAAMLQGKMRERNLEAREQNVMYGTGSAGTLNGFMNEGSHSTDTWSTALEVGDTEADLIAYSAMQIPSSRPLFAILNKTDWNSLVRRKASDGHYVNTAYGPMRIIDTPSMKAVGPVQVVLARHMLSTTGLLIDPAGASELYPQAGLAAFEMAYEGTDFTNNQITLLYEEAWAHLILDYTLFRGLSFDAAPSAT